jgi:hypothetical protein
MGAITANDVTVTIVPRERQLVGTMKMALATLAFGGGAMTYPANGVPLPAKEKFGINKKISFVNLQDPIDGLVYKYDPTNHTIRIYQSAAVVDHAHTFDVAAHTHDLKVMSGADAAPLFLGADSSLAASASGTIAGSASATKGGVMSTDIASANTGSAGAVSAAALSEVATGAAVASTSLAAQIWGF